MVKYDKSILIRGLFEFIVLVASSFVIIGVGIVSYNSINDSIYYVCLIIGTIIGVYIVEFSTITLRLAVKLLVTIWVFGLILTSMLNIFGFINLTQLPIIIHLCVYLFGIIVGIVRTSLAAFIVKQFDSSIAILSWPIVFIVCFCCIPLSFYIAMKLEENGYLFLGSFIFIFLAFILALIFFYVFRKQFVTETFKIKHHIKEVNAMRIFLLWVGIIFTFFMLVHTIENIWNTIPTKTPYDAIIEITHNKVYLGLILIPIIAATGTKFNQIWCLLAGCILIFLSIYIWKNITEFCDPGEENSFTLNKSWILVNHRDCSYQVSSANNKMKFQLNLFSVHQITGNRTLFNLKAIDDSCVSDKFTANSNTTFYLLQQDARQIGAKEAGTVKFYNINFTRPNNRHPIVILILGIKILQRYTHLATNTKFESKSDFLIMEFRPGKWLIQINDNGWTEGTEVEYNYGGYYIQQVVIKYINAFQKNNRPITFVNQPVAVLPPAKCDSNTYFYSSTMVLGRFLVIISTLIISYENIDQCQIKALHLGFWFIFYDLASIISIIINQQFLDLLALNPLVIALFVVTILMLSIIFYVFFRHDQSQDFIKNIAEQEKLTYVKVDNLVTKEPAKDKEPVKGRESVKFQESGVKGRESLKGKESVRGKEPSKDKEAVKDKEAEKVKVSQPVHVKEPKRSSFRERVSISTKDDTSGQPSTSARASTSARQTAVGEKRKPTLNIKRARK